MAEWLIVCLRTKWLWAAIPFQPLISYMASFSSNKFLHIQAITGPRFTLNVCVASLKTQHITSLLYAMRHHSIFQPSSSLGYIAILALEGSKHRPISERQHVLGTKLSSKRGIFNRANISRHRSYLEILFTEN